MQAINGRMAALVAGAATLATGVVLAAGVVTTRTHEQTLAMRLLDAEADAIAARVAERTVLLTDIAAGMAQPALLRAIVNPAERAEQGLDPAAVASLRATTAARRQWCGISGGRFTVAVPQAGGHTVASAAVADLLWPDGPPRPESPDAALLPAGSPAPAGSRVRTITVLGREWTLAVSPTPGWSAALPATVWPWLAGGAAVAASLAGLLGWRLVAQSSLLDHLDRRRLDDIKREISTRHRTEHELGRAREQLELLAAAVAKTTVGVVIGENTAHAASSTVVFVNPAATRLLGMTSTQALGMSLEALLAGGDNGAAARALLKDLAAGEHHRSDVALAGGYLAVSASPLRDEGGRVAHHLVMLSDVTDRHAAELALRESEDRFRRLADAAPVMIWMVSSDNAITYRNQSYITFTGMGPDAYITGRENVHPDDLDAWQAVWDRAFMHREPYEMEYRQRNAGGEWRWLAESGVPRQAPDGSFTGFIGICRDVTDRRQMIDSLRAAKEAAEAADEAKSAFLAMMSHEIRTPLHGIMGMTALLLEEDLPVHQRELAMTVRTCGDHLLGIVNDVLDFSRIAAGKLELDVAEFDLRSVVEDALATLGEAAHGKDLELAAHIDPALPDHLLGDAGRIRQILVNLVGNAVKFTGVGSVVVRATWRGPDLAATVATRRRSQSATLVAGAVEFRIEDTGPGISPEILPNLFQPFTQGDNSTTRQHGGTGLGLVICRRLAELMSGSVIAESEIGRGTTMICNLRLVPVPGPARPTEPLVIGRRIAVLDDRLQERAMCAGLVEDLGGEAVACESSAEARAQAAAGAAVVIADCSHVADLAGCGRPVIALATLAERAARAAGDLPVLTRPVRRNALRAALAEALHA